MSTAAGNFGSVHTSTHYIVTGSAVDRVITLLRYTFGLVPIVAGADKFTHLLVNWNQYLALAIANALPVLPSTFMLIVGVVEIVAGLIVLMRPRIGSLLVGLWLLGIAVNLVLAGFYDIAVRDTVMAIGAFSLFILTGKRDHH